MTRIAVIGIGAIGGYVAAQVAAAGHDMVLCARRPFDRLVVTSGSRVTTVDQPAVVDPSHVVPVDWVLLATKVHQSDGALPWIERLCDDRTRAIVTLQNGIEIPPAVLEAAGSTPVVPSVVLFGAELTAPGTVVHHGVSRLIVPSAWASALRALVAGGDLVVDESTHFAADAWRKLVMNTMSGPLCALTRRRLEVFHDPSIASLAVRVGTECVAVARASGVSLRDDLADELLAVLRAQPATMGGSMLYDVLAGRRTEHDAITGAVLRAAAAAAVAVPTVATLHALLDGASRDAGGL